MYAEVIAGVIGGLGLFLFGIHLMSNSLKALSMGLLRDLLAKITSNRIKSVFLGITVTSLIQSSSATSVILIGFINAGMLTLRPALPVILGATIGTTITAQLIAFNLTKSALFFLFAGAMVHLFAKKDKTKNKALAVVGFGLLFMGLGMMSSSVKPLTENEAIVNLFFMFGAYPLLGILTGLVVTVILQSSSTTIGVVIALASAGLLDLPSSIYLVVGDNIGTCVTALIASIGGKWASRRLAVGHMLFKVVGAMIFLPLVPLYLHFIPMLSGDIARQIANTHTIFNVINTIILLPFIPLFVKLLERIVPGKDYEKKEGGYLEPHLLNTPDLAIAAAVKELSVMLDLCREMLEKARHCTERYDSKLKGEIAEDENSVDDMQKKITAYLTELTQSGLTDKQRYLVPAIIHSVNDVEKVGDYCEDIVKLSQRLYENDLTFSPQAQAEMSRLFDKTEVLMKHTRQALDNNDERAAQITLNIDAEINALTDQYKLNHINRLEEGLCLSNAGLVFSDILTDLQQLSNHLCNITKGILHRGKR